MNKTTFKDAWSGDEVAIKTDRDHVVVQLGPDGISASFRLTPEDAIHFANHLLTTGINLLVHWATKDDGGS